MEELVVALPAVNPPALDAALRAALGDQIAGISVARGEVRVHFSGRPSAQDVARARDIVSRHDAAEPTPDQQARRDRAARRAALQQEIAALDLDAPLPEAALDKAVRWLLLRELGRAEPDA